MTTKPEKWQEWYYTQNEYKKMCRYFPHIMFNVIDVNNSYVPDYTNINLGVIVSTYGSRDVIKLQLHFLKNVAKIEHVLIVDDCSPEKDYLQQLCNEYKVDFKTTFRKLPYANCVGSNGDTAGFLYGLQWAQQNNINLLVKLSRRLVAPFDWTTKLKELAKKSEATTFTSYCVKDKFNVRTECMGMYVPAWSHPYVMNALSWLIQNDYIIFAEYWFHEIAKMLAHYNKSPKWEQFQKEQNLPYPRTGYALWTDIAGTNRYNKDNRDPRVLWHMYSSEDEYRNLLKQITKN